GQHYRLKCDHSVPARESHSGDMHTIRERIPAANRPEVYESLSGGEHDDYVLALALAAWCALSGEATARHRYREAQVRAEQERRLAGWTGLSGWRSIEP